MTNGKLCGNILGNTARSWELSHMRTMVLEYAHIHLAQKLPSFVGYVGNYSSTMEHLGIGKSQEIVINIGILGCLTVGSASYPVF
jgi:hypothetical protein